MHERYLGDVIPEAVELLKPGKGEEGTKKVTEARLRTAPAIVVGTPSGVLEYKDSLDLSSLKVRVSNLRSD